MNIIYTTINLNMNTDQHFKSSLSETAAVVHKVIITIFSV